MRKMLVASDGSVHKFPDGYVVEVMGEWLNISDENGKVVAMFFRPRYALEIE